MKFTIKQIAAQAGVSKATVDRALHKRGAVHAQTQRRIRQAINDLELQERTNLASGRTVAVDVILHTPQRFSRLVCDALIDEIHRFAPFRLNLRFHCFETISVREMRKLMLRCANDSYGIVLKAENHPLLARTIDELQKHRVPVVTLVTDIPQSKRLRYIGIDNLSAGRTAAYLMSQWLRNAALDVAVVLSSQNFLGEEERVSGFSAALRTMAPTLSPIRISEGYGMDDPTFEVMCRALRANPRLQAVYCVGGGNAAILRAFAACNREIATYLGHDVDEENRRLLLEGKINAVIQHDLHQDARAVFQTLLVFHGFLAPRDLTSPWSVVNVITPYNV
ncbi:LacI family DNA-binding transcriptional regulator (plasmid) [Klebsiella michiganensis]|uniref:LacI family DNA-binding transcriptional regulator n=1 Tax=Klebsiella michiganensis TaxID=1134687 RepID=UPI0021D9507F|nr:LacI family DNA-binding transcriptional regulator [Klebsiella michiganensis]UYB60026.1 LacI family DNA-binding transcriptional regulator [Klebsiella michiganensis]